MEAACHKGWRADKAGEVVLKKNCKVGSHSVVMPGISIGENAVVGAIFEPDYKNISDVDLIAVMTPSGKHPLHVAEIAENCDAPHIVCEKPISLTVREAHGGHNQRHCEYIRAELHN